MNPKLYNNHSGGAKGADSYWDEIGREYGVVNHFHYYYLKPNPKSKPEHEISEKSFKEGVKMVYRANKILKRKNIEKYMHLLARNWMQVKNSTAIYAIGNLNKNKILVNGGTGWAVQMAIDENKIIYVFDQNLNKWFFWNNNKFEICLTPKLELNFAGIGTRNINENGINAIKNVYEKTFKY